MICPLVSEIYSAMMNNTLHTLANCSTNLLLLLVTLHPAPHSVFATGQSVRPEPGRGRTAVCRPVRSFSKCPASRNGRRGRTAFWRSRLFLNLPYKKSSRTRTDEIVSSPSSPSSPVVPVVFGRLPLFPVISRYSPLISPSPAVPRRPPPPPTVPYKNMSQIVGLVVLPNDGRPGNSRTRTDGILSSRLVILSSWPTSRNERRGRTTFCRPRLVPGTWQSPRWVLRGPRTTTNTVYTVG